MRYSKLIKNIQAYISLARLEKPIGVILLMLPCWWGIALATPPLTLPDPILLIVFAWGAFFLRGAGCTYNDYIDRNIDRQVARTAFRPLAAKTINTQNAFYFLLIQLFLGALTLCWLSPIAIVIALSSVVLVLLYPYMKRFTWWPQAFLGLTFNIGILVGYATIRKNLDMSAWLLYGAGLSWTIIYDTIYAHQDREDDALIGVKSTARLFGQHSKIILGFFAFLLIGLLGGTLYISNPPSSHLVWIVVAGFIVLAGLLGRNIWSVNIHHPLSCLRAFRFHRWIGLAIFLLIIGSKFW